MNDVADGRLLDVRDINLSDLEFTDTESALNLALGRILGSNSDCCFNSFSESLSRSSFR